MTQGDHVVCWGDVPDYTAPACVTANVTAGGLTTEVGTFTPGGGSPGPAPDIGAYGYLRATTSPPVGATISVDGIPRNAWGLDWMKIPVGEHVVCFGGVVGFDEQATSDGGLPCQLADVTEGGTTVVEGPYTQLGLLEVQVDPAGLPVDILVNGFPVNKFGALVWLPPGDYEVCFTELGGYTTPACQDPVTITAGATTPVTGAYT